MGEIVSNDVTGWCYTPADSNALVEGLLEIAASDSQNDCVVAAARAESMERLSQDQALPRTAARLRRRMMPITDLSRVTSGPIRLSRTA